MGYRLWWVCFYLCGTMLDHYEQKAEIINTRKQMKNRHQLNLDALANTAEQRIDKFAKVVGLHGRSSLAMRIFRKSALHLALEKAKQAIEAIMSKLAEAQALA